MNKLRSMLTWMAIRPIRFGIFPAVIIGIGIIVLSPGANQLSPAPQQPMPFSHQIMVTTNGINCVFCHADVLRSPAAGMPSVEKCVGCHKIIDPKVPQIQQLTQYWTDQKPIPWARVDELPRFVRFNHQAHVVAGAQNCENCHGDVAHMTVTQQAYKFSMGFCMNCHIKQPDRPDLIMCDTCHQ